MKVFTTFDRVKPHIWLRNGLWECGSVEGVAEARAISPLWAYRGWKMLNDGTVFEAQGAE